MINRPRQTEVGITIVYTHSVHVTSLKSPFAQRFPAFENHLSSLIHQAWWRNVIIHSFWLLIFISCDIINPTISVCFPRISFSKKKIVILFWTDSDDVFVSFPKEDKREDSRKMFCYHYPPANLHPSIASRLQSALDLPGSFGVGPPSLTCKFNLFQYVCQIFFFKFNSRMIETSPLDFSIRLWYHNKMKSIPISPKIYYD